MKQTFTGLYTKWDSFTPRKYKINLIRTLTYRCLRICSSSFLLQSALFDLKKTLLQNGYPRGVLCYNMNHVLNREHSRPQSLRSFWPAAGIESSGSNHYERTKERTEFWLSGSLRICIYGACLKWLLPELSIPAADQKDRGLWGRE